MYDFNRSLEFDDWLIGLRDQKVKAHILARLASAQLWNFGDCAPVGDGVSEMRVHFGPGHRVYFVRKGLMVYLLFWGGDKSSQESNIARALVLAAAMKGE